MSAKTPGMMALTLRFKNCALVYLKIVQAFSLAKNMSPILESVNEMTMKPFSDSLETA
jgi:hypothetical protein